MTRYDKIFWIWIGLLIFSVGSIMLSNSIARFHIFAVVGLVVGIIGSMILLFFLIVVPDVW